MSTEKKKATVKETITGIIGLIIIILVLNWWLCDGNKGSKKRIKKTSEVVSTDANKKEKKTYPGVKETLKTNYFEIKLNKYSIKKAVYTGNQFANLKPEKGNKFLILNVTFKNIDTESRMILGAGDVIINYNGKEYTYEKTETVMLEGWGLILDELNPLITKKTNLVYKIPSELKGKIYWQPARASDDEIFYVGEIK